MTTSSLESGMCPKCGANDVFTSRRDKPLRIGERSHLSVTTTARLYLDTYVCLGCGHFEELVPKTELATWAAAVRAEWKKV
jgi:hypothetical protein